MSIIPFPASGQQAPRPGSSPYCPPGLVGEIARFCFEAAPRPVAEIAFVAGIGLVAGIAGRAFNVSGTGLNQYLMMLAGTGTGKEACASGISKLIAAVGTIAQDAPKFYGPSEIRSDAALLKWLATNECFVSVVGEFGLRLKQMTARNASPSEIGIKRVLLDIFNKSGFGETLQPMIYSDKDKNTSPITSPSVTLIGESTPERFYEVLDLGMVYEGLLPRFTFVEYLGPRPEMNEAHSSVQPSPELLQQLARLISRVLDLQRFSMAVNVNFTPEAKAKFDDFNRHCDAMINAADAKEVTRQFWTRAHVKAMKLAATVAVGIDCEAPIIDIACAQWATDLMHNQTVALIDKFASGETGEVEGDETKQTNAVLRCIFEFIYDSDASRLESYGVKTEMHRDKVFTQTYLSRRLINLPAFKPRPTEALKRVITNLIEGDVIRELPKSQMATQYATTARAFAISNPELVIDIGRKK